MGIPTSNPANNNNDGSQGNNQNPRQGNVPRQGIPRQNPNATNNQGKQGGIGQHRPQQGNTPQQNPGMRQNAPQRPQQGQNQGQGQRPAQPTQGNSGMSGGMRQNRPQNPQQNPGARQNPTQRNQNPQGQGQSSPNQQRPQQRHQPIVNSYDDANDDVFQNLSQDEQQYQESIEQEQTSFDMNELFGSVPDETAAPINDNFAQFDQQPDTFSQEASRNIGEVIESTDFDYTQPARDSSTVQQKNAVTSERYTPDLPARNTGNDGQNQFVNFDENELDVFSGKNKRKIKESNYDPRRADIRKKAVIVRGVVIALALVLVGLGVKNAIFPPDQLSVDEVAAISASVSGITNFPTEGGKGYVEDFMKAYLSIDPQNPDNNNVLSFFYNGKEGLGTESVGRIPSGNYGQSIVSGPTIYAADALSDHSANYTVGAIVKPYAIGKENNREYGEIQVQYFSVNVYYDENTEKYSITPDSPTIIPDIEFTDSESVPKAVLLGTGETDAALQPELKTLVMQFMKGYAVSSPGDYSAVAQYIKNSKEVDLENGLRGRYTFRDGDVESAVTYTVFERPEGVKESKILIDTYWQQKVGSPDTPETISYKSQYVMTVVKSGSQYLVTKFAPFKFTRDEATYESSKKNQPEKVEDEIVAPEDDGTAKEEATTAVTE